MNRKERRKLEKKYPKALVMQKYREDAIQEGHTQGRKDALDIILYMTAYTINYKLGFGSKRLCTLMYQILDNIDAYRTGHLSPEDFNIIKEEVNKLGFSIKR